MLNLPHSALLECRGMVTNNDADSLAGQHLLLQCRLRCTVKHGLAQVVVYS